MKILFLKDVSGSGRAGEIKEVSDGYARNFLLPKKLATIATKSAINVVEKERREKLEKTKRQEEKLKELSDKLSKSLFVILGKASKQHLFAQVTKEQIAEVINKRFELELPPDRIELKTPIKQLGPSEVEIRLAAGNKTLIHLEIKPE